MQTCKLDLTQYLQKELIANCVFGEPKSEAYIVTERMYEEQIFIGVIAVIQACCKPVLQSSTEHWGMHFAENCVAMPWLWVTEHLYEEQIFMGVVAMIQACCKPVLQSSTEHWGMGFAENSVAVPWCWATAHLYEEEIFIGVTAVIQACCKPVLQSSSDQ